MFRMMMLALLALALLTGGGGCNKAKWAERKRQNELAKQDKL